MSDASGRDDGERSGSGQLISIDISGFSEPRRNLMMAWLQNVGFVLLYSGVAFVAIVYGAFLTTRFGFSERFSIGVFFVAAALFMGVVIHVSRSLDEWVSGGTLLGSELPFSRADLDRPVPGIGPPLRRILADVAAFIDRTGTDAATPALRRDRLIVGAHHFASGLLIFGGVVAYASLDGVRIGLPLVPDFLVRVALVVGLFSLVGTLYRRSTRYGRPTVETVRALDRRPPVLFLRSFRDDQLRVMRRFPVLPWAIYWAIRFEQAVASRFRHVGPVIAVSAPGEDVPQLGAARLRLADGEWQARVIDWIAESQIIAMAAGTTEWIRWELEQIVERGGIERLYILMPPGSRFAESSAERWANVLRPFAGTPWRLPLEEVDPETTLLVQLEADGGVTAFRSRGHMMRDYQIAITLGIWRRHGRLPA